MGDLILVFVGLVTVLAFKTAAVQSVQKESSDFAWVVYLPATWALFLFP